MQRVVSALYAAETNFARRRSLAAGVHGFGGHHDLVHDRGSALIREGRAKPLKARLKGEGKLYLELSERMNKKGKE